MDLLDAVPRLGWTPTRAQLIEVAGRAEVDRAILSGRIVRVSQGRYALPNTITGASAAAVRCGGVMSHLSAAIYWGLPVKQPPPQPMVTVPRGRNLGAARRRQTWVAWGDLPAADVHQNEVTGPLRTVLDCAARLPFDEALVVADAALRAGMISIEQLVGCAAQVPKQFRASAIKVASHADPRAQSPFESLVRGYSLDVAGLMLVPQVPVAGFHPDLYDADLGLAVECDSFEFHSTRNALLRDCERYNVFALERVVLVRFAWEHSMSRPDYVLQTLERAVAVLGQSAVA